MIGLFGALLGSSHIYHGIESGSRPPHSTPSQRPHKQKKDAKYIDSIKNNKSLTVFD